MENYDLLMSCSPSEMLDLWKTVMRLTPVRRECTIERDDGIDLDALLMQPENAADMELVTEYTTTHQALEQANEQWMELSEQLESLKNE